MPIQVQVVTELAAIAEVTINTHIDDSPSLANVSSSDIVRKKESQPALSGFQLFLDAIGAILATI